MALNTLPLVLFGNRWEPILIKLVCDKNDYVPSEEAVNWAAKMFDLNVCQPIDNTDNFGPKKYPNPLVDMISSYNSDDIRDNEKRYEGFYAVVLLLEQLLQSDLEKVWTSV